MSLPAFVLAGNALAQPQLAYPAWFERDLARKAAWLPDQIKRDGLVVSYTNRLRLFPEDIQAILNEMRIPPWLIALVPGGVEVQAEINKQMRAMTDMSGEAPDNKYGARFEQLAMFAGSAQLPTLGDINTGRGLGDEGCSATMSRYLLAQMVAEFPELQALNHSLTVSQSSADMRRMLTANQSTGYVRVRRVPFVELLRSAFKPGTLLIADKPGGTHVMAWSRVPRMWNWDADDLMAIGNTGLAPYGNRMCLAQDYVTSDSNLISGDYKELHYNRHGPINMNNLGALSDPHTNIYASKHTAFFMVDFLDPALGRVAGKGPTRS